MLIEFYARDNSSTLKLVKRCLAGKLCGRHLAGVLWTTPLDSQISA